MIEIPKGSLTAALDPLVSTKGIQAMVNRQRAFMRRIDWKSIKFEINLPLIRFSQRSRIIHTRALGLGA